MVSAERPNVYFVTTPGELTQAKGGFASPLDISPRLPEFASVNVMDLEQSAGNLTELAIQVADNIHSHISEYSGFVVTADKYCIQHLAPRLAFALGPTLSKTVVVAGTNISAEVTHSGAREDLVKAAMIANAPFREVVISFSDYVVRGTNSRVRSDGSSNLRYEARSDPKYDNLGQVTSLGLEVSHLRDRQEGEDSFHNDFETNVLAISVDPGFQPEFYRDVALKSKGVIIESPGWSLPTRRRHSVLPLINDLRIHNIPVMLTSRVDDGLLEYGESQGERIIEVFDGFAGRFMGIETAAAKFSWVIKIVDDEITQGKLPENGRLARVKDLMQKPYVGEFGIHKPFNEFEL